MMAPLDSGALIKEGSCIDTCWMTRLFEALTGLETASTLLLPLMMPISISSAYTATNSDLWVSPTKLKQPMFWQRRSVEKTRLSWRKLNFHQTANILPSVPMEQIVHAKCWQYRKTDLENIKSTKVTHRQYYTLTGAKTQRYFQPTHKAMNCYFWMPIGETKCRQQHAEMSNGPHGLGKLVGLLWAFSKVSTTPT